MNKMLIIETASACPFLFLKKDNQHEILFFENGPNLSKKIHSNLYYLLSKFNLHIKDLETIAIGIGPGSYTGLRVGACLAKTFSYSLNIPLISFYSHEAFIPNIDQPFAILFDARSQGVYVYKSTNNLPIKIPLDEITDHLSKIENIYTPDPLLIEKLCKYSLSINFCKPNLDLLIESLKKRDSNNIYNEVALLYS